MRQGFQPLADYGTKDDKSRSPFQPLADDRTNDKSRSPFQPLADYGTNDESRQLLLQSKKPTASKSPQCSVKYGDSSNN